MVVGGIQPNWRHIFLGLVILAVIWYAFHGSKVNTKYIQEGILAQPIKKLQVEVYYEVWCPDSRRYIIDQALPAWEKFEAIVDLHWKPYGKASHVKSETENTGYTFECQHGPEECMGNMIHACAVKHVKDSRVLNKLIGCMMQDNRDIKANAEKCIISHEVNWKQIQSCSESKEGGELLAVLGDDTKSLKPRVHFIPTVQINGSQDNQKLMLKDLSKAICELYKQKDNSAATSLCDTN